MITVADDRAITGTEKAYTYARSGIARSGATRSNYVTAWTTVEIIRRDDDGAIVSRTDITDYIRYGSLQVTQALNDEADTASFTIVPTAPAAAVPNVGDEIAVAWTPGDVLFHGYSLVQQYDRRVMNESPWVSVQCQDAMWRFDARIVSFRFPTQSITDSITFLVRNFCNVDPIVPHPFDFMLTAVQAAMPSVPGFDVVNQRPSTVLRRLTASVQGGFYVDGLEVHAWAGSLSEPNRTNPQPLTNTLASLKSFRLTTDATQLRRGVIVEGRRTSTLIGLPAIDTTVSPPIGIPLEDATLFDEGAGDPDFQHHVRLGPQWMQLQAPVVVQGDNPPQTRVQAPFTVGDDALLCDPIDPPPPITGWIRIGNQYAAYQSSSTTAGTLTLVLASTIHPYGQLTVPVDVGETVEWIDCVIEDYPLALQWDVPATIGRVLAEPIGTPIVLLAHVHDPPDRWPPIEGFVQDGRYSYAGARARATADLAAFRDPLVTAEWETEDLNAAPGRLQVMNLTGASVIDPVTQPVTITRVDLSFFLRSLPPRRRCLGGDLKASTFLDVVLTDES